MSKFNLFQFLQLFNLKLLIFYKKFGILHEDLFDKFMWHLTIVKVDVFSDYKKQCMIGKHEIEGFAYKETHC